MFPLRKPGEILRVKVSETEKQRRNLESNRDVGKDRSLSKESVHRSRMQQSGQQRLLGIFWSCLLRCPKRRCYFLPQGLSLLLIFLRLINPSKFDSFQTAHILTTLPGHKASVNCTHWLPSSKFAFKGSFFFFFSVSCLLGFRVFIMFHSFRD